MGVKYETKAAGEDGKGVSLRVSVPLVQTVPLVGIFFSSAFSNLLVDWYSSCWNVSSCCVHVHTCAEEKKNPQKDLNVLVENDTWTRESKKQTKRIIHAGAAKKCCLNRLRIL